MDVRSLLNNAASIAEKLGKNWVSLATGIDIPESLSKNADELKSSNAYENFKKFIKTFNGKLNLVEGEDLRKVIEPIIKNPQRFELLKSLNEFFRGKSIPATTTNVETKKLVKVTEWDDLFLRLVKLCFSTDKPLIVLSALNTVLHKNVLQAFTLWLNNLKYLTTDSRLLEEKKTGDRFYERDLYLLTLLT